MARLLHAVKGVVGFARLAGDMNRLDEVFRIAESFLDPALLAESREHLSRTPEGRAALRDRPRLGRIDLGALRALPAGTLGRAFAEHMIANGLDPAALPSLEGRDELEYIWAHFYETHDVWHAVTGYGTDVAGELGLQAFYLARGPARLSAMVLAAGLLNLVVQAGRFDDRDRCMRAIAHGWLLGRRAQNLFGVRWNELWSTPLAEVRARFGVDIDAVDALVGEPVSTSAAARYGAVPAEAAA